MRTLALTTFVQHFTGGYSKCNKEIQRNIKHPHWKGGIKISFFTDMTTYVENLIKSQKVTKTNK